MGDTYHRDDHDGPSLSKKAESLAHFKGRIDKLLKFLDESPAAKSEISNHRVTSAAYGKFPAAESLASTYTRVHERLEQFSQVLGDQLEMLGFAVQIADRGYDSIDAEQAARLREIQARAERDYPQRRDGTSEGSEKDTPHTGTGRSGSADSDFH